MPSYADYHHEAMFEEGIQTMDQEVLEEILDSQKEILNQESIDCIENNLDNINDCLLTFEIDSDQLFFSLQDQPYFNFEYDLYPQDLDRASMIYQKTSDCIKDKPNQISNCLDSLEDYLITIDTQIQIGEDKYVDGYHHNALNFPEVNANVLYANVLYTDFLGISLGILIDPKIAPPVVPETKNCTKLLDQIEKRLFARNISEKKLKMELAKIKERCSDNECKICEEENYQRLSQEVRLLIL